MGRSPMCQHLARAIRLAHFCGRNRFSARDGLARAAELQARRGISRRELLSRPGKLALTGVAGAVVGPVGRAFAASKPGGSANIGIVGAGLAGLSCAYELKKRGIAATQFEATADRVGGRCFSLGGLFPGQVAERGGEFIDTAHKTLLGSAPAFNLQLEDVSKSPPGEVFYLFNGQLYSGYFTSTTENP